MSDVIDLEALSSAKLQTKPYPWATYEDSFKHVPADDAFPDGDFSSHSQQKILEAIGKKGSDAWFQHNVETRPLLELGESQPYRAEELDDVWLATAEDLLTPQYRECISEVAGHDVRGLKMQAHFWRYKPGSFFQPHVDKPHKIVTHLMYLTAGWAAEMGGCFRILSSGSPDDVFEEVPPDVGRSILLKRTDNAWHSVSAIPRSCAQPRLVLQVWFWGTA
jgi:SM-20-related protein